MGEGAAARTSLIHDSTYYVFSESQGRRYEKGRKLVDFKGAGVKTQILSGWPESLWGRTSWASGRGRKQI